MPEKSSTVVITVRIEEDLNQNIEKIRSKLGISKADFIRKYLDMSKYLVIQNNLLKSLNNRDFILIKKSFLRKLLEGLEETEQMEMGLKSARFINDIARLQGQIDNIEYKLDLCEHLGFFPKFIDEEKYILISKKFGPRKFIEAFTYKLINHEPKFNFDMRFTEETISSQSKIRTSYEKLIQPIERSSSHFSFEFAKIPEEETE
ncbi:MAG: hypothetical protein ACFE8C_02790 [Promethearchaeota archaeon]